MERLAVYGSLAPGAVNHGVIAGVPGTWHPGTVRGTLHQRGWGSAHGFSGLTWHPDGDPVRVHVLESPELVPHLERLDAFESDDYRRTIVPVTRDDGAVVPAWIYLIRWDDPDLRPVLSWLSELFRRADRPFEITGGLAARVYGAERPLADVDCWVPGDALDRLRSSLAPHLERAPAVHRDEHWELTFARLVYQGVPIELGVAEGARYRDARNDVWREVAVDFERSALGWFQDLALSVTPRAQLVMLKRALGRPVDVADLWHLAPEAVD